MQICFITELLLYQHMPKIRCTVSQGFIDFFDGFIPRDTDDFAFVKIPK